MRNVIIFSIAALASGWIGRLVDMFIEPNPNGSVGQLVWLVSPLLLMIILRTFAGDGWSDFGIKPKLKENIFFYFFSILFYPILSITIILIGLSFKLMDTSIFSADQAVLFLSMFGMSLIPMLIKNIFEEFSWRGYLAPKLFSLGLNRFITHLWVGVIWAAWHFPYLFVFGTYTTESMITFIPRMMIGVVILAIVYGEIRLMTKSVWPAVIMHTVGNAFVDILIINKFIEMNTGKEYLIMPSPDGVIVMALTAITGLWLYKLRIKVS